MPTLFPPEIEAIYAEFLSDPEYAAEVTEDEKHDPLEVWTRTVGRDLTLDQLSTYLRLKRPQLFEGRKQDPHPTPAPEGPARVAVYAYRKKHHLDFWHPLDGSPLLINELERLRSGADVSTGLVVVTEKGSTSAPLHLPLPRSRKTKERKRARAS
jgi:hypothetical protein